MAQKKDKEAMKKSITPQEIVMREDDSDMPQPETKQYKKYLKCSDHFVNLVHECLGKFPYNFVLDNGKGSKIRLTDFIRYIDQKRDKIEVDDMNNFISYIAAQEYNKVLPIMSIVESKDQQGQLWSMFEE